MAVAEFKILDRRVVSSIEPARFGKRDQVVVYQTDAAHTYTLRLPAELVDEAQIAQLIRADIKARTDLAGRTFTL